MLTWHKLKVLLRKDLQAGFRDRFMLVLALLPLVVAAALRVTVILGLQFVPWLPPDTGDLVAPMVLLFAPYMIGLAAGLGLVSEREMRTALSLRVMPLSWRSFAAYQSGWPAVLAMVVAPFCLVLYGTMPSSWPAAAAMIVAVSATTGLLAFFLGGLAANRIQAMAAAKSLGLLMFTGMAVFAVPAKSQLLVIWSPWYWSYVGLLAALNGDSAAQLSLVQWPSYPQWLPAVACLLTSGAWTLLLARRYHRGAAG